MQLLRLMGLNGSNRELSVLERFVLTFLSVVAYGNNSFVVKVVYRLRCHVAIWRSLLSSKISLSS